MLWTKKRIFLQILVILCLAISVLGIVVNQCNNAGAATLPTQYQSYLTPQSVNLTQEQQIITLYNSLGTVGNYSASISSSFSLYINKLPLCDKNPTALYTYNSQYDIWLCFDSYYLLQCNAEWSIILNCGTFLQFHKPFNPEVLIRIDLA